MTNNIFQTRSWNDHLNNQNILKGKFSSNERDIINNSVKEYIKSQHWNWDEGLDNLFSTRGRKKDRHWPIIGESLPNRSLQSIYYCAKRMLMRGKKGKWTREEEQELIKLVNEHGKKWSMFVEFIGRSAASIRDKWRDLHTKVGENNLDDSRCSLNSNSQHEKLLKSKMPFVIDVFVLYCIEHYTGKFLPFKGISWKAIIESFCSPNFPKEYISFWKKCCRKINKKLGVHLQPINGVDLSNYYGKISQGQIRLRYVSSLYPKLKSIQGEQTRSLISNTFSQAVKYLYETRYNYSHIDEIKYNDWPKLLSAHIPLTTLWSRIRLALTRITKKNMHISDRISILYERLRNKQLQCQDLDSIDSTDSKFLLEDEGDYANENIDQCSYFHVDTKRLRKIVVKLLRTQSKREKRSKNTSRLQKEYSSLQQVFHSEGYIT
ncbi:MYB domain-containing protein [Cryptosporidium ubiquitum]|uniref:MYB domain-containing protein n=1 Tax=Cryptosporidium ubiquitum TaxID=857276 RepID=A0A1J4MJ07_9CRYT|nr:MYB domain-containing protein [Cryptosporidium ubiquitum]OII74217.1 MYB domain-containing protein [Cryptosporidium ubiquitum]